jgi:hypothetical protein
MKRDILQLLRYLHFDNRNQPVTTDENCDRLWKMTAIFGKLNYACAKYYSPTERLAVDKMIMLLKGRVIFRRHIQKKHRRFVIEIYKLCDPKGHAYNMSLH